MAEQASRRGCAARPRQGRRRGRRSLRGQRRIARLQAADAEGGLPVTISEPTRLVDEDDVVRIGGEDFRVLHLPGHADGHIALLGLSSGRLFGGDVILATISPNVGRWEDTAFDPLGRYFATLERLAEPVGGRLVPEVRPVPDAPQDVALAPRIAERSVELEGLLERPQRLVRRHELLGQEARKAGVDDRPADGRRGPAGRPGGLRPRPVRLVFIRVILTTASRSSIYSPG